MFDKVLIANRGEIALRVIRACRDLGISTVAVHSEADKDAMHVRLADESVCIGPAKATQSYLNMAAIISACEVSGAQAVHPGYGFLAENPKFVDIVEAHDLIFIGPKADHIRIMGDKITAKKTMIELGVPVVPGTEGAVETVEDAAKEAGAMGYPVLIKASAGGGGRGMKIARNPEEIADAYDTARAEAKAGFGDDAVYIEKYLGKPRHIEIQIVADAHGNVAHLGERDCSLQRRNQKILEEAPSPCLTAEQRNEIGDICRKAIEKLGYLGVGTLEFLYEDNKFYFIEMNTRIQVEHPVTELVAGVDLVREQILIAAGEKLSFRAEDIKISGHAIECRVNAEHPETFRPSPGLITGFHVPGGPGVRVDSAVFDGYRIPPHYDSLIGKLIISAPDRKQCLARLKRALEEFVVEGIDTTLPLFEDLLSCQDIINGDYHIHWLEEYLSQSD